MEKEAVVLKYNGTLLSHKKEQMWISWTEADEPRTYYTECSKSENKLSHINTYIWNLEKRYWWTYLEGKNRDTDVEDRCTDTEGKDRVEQTQRRALPCAHHHVQES